VESFLLTEYEGTTDQWFNARERYAGYAEQENHLTKHDGEIATLQRTTEFWRLDESAVRAAITASWASRWCLATADT
jgi:hypothetical protein